MRVHGRVVPRLVGGRGARGGRAVAALPRRRAARQRRARCATAPPGPRAYAAGSAAATRSRGAPSCCCCRPTPTATPGPSSRCSPIVEDLRPGVAALRPGLLAVRAPGSWYGSETDAAATCSPGPGRGRASGTCRVGIADDLFTAEQAARRARTSRRATVVPAGGSPAFLRGLPVEVLQDDGPRGASRQPAAAARPAHPGRPGRPAGRRRRAPVRAPTARRCGGGRGARTRRCSRRAPRRPSSTRRSPSSRRSTPSRRSPSASAPPPSGSSTELAHHQLVATGVRVEAESDGVVCSSRDWLHPRHFSARDLVDRVHWQLQSAASGSLRAASDAGAVRAPIDRVRFVPEVVEPAAAHGEALWGGASDDLVERGVARVQGMVGFDAVRRPVLQGGRSPAATAGAGAVGRARRRPAPGRPAVAGPGARAGTGPGVRRRRWPPRSSTTPGRDVRVTDRGVVTGEPDSGSGSTAACPGSR